MSKKSRLDDINKRIANLRAARAEAVERRVRLMKELQEMEREMVDLALAYPGLVIDVSGGEES